MICVHCQTKNPAQARFCLHCGSAFIEPEQCPACQSVLIPNADYCYRCGFPLGESSDAREIALAKYIPQELQTKLKAARTGHSMEGERRIVTMLFCDVKGSTAMAEKLDPEDWSEIMNGTFEYLIRPIYHYEGTLARLMGDSILAFFGAPIAHEDDPQRAVLAGMEIINGIEAYREYIQDQWGITLDVRVGINTGLVVVGEMGSDLRVEYTAMGDAVNVAARMEQTAQPGSVQIAGETYHLVSQFFECEPQAGIVIKGKSEPVTAYRVIRTQVRPGQMRGIAGLTAPMVGRDSELAALQKVMERVQQGRGQIVCLIGEAGLGKSRMMAELRTGWNGPWHETTCISYEATHPYAAYRQHLRVIYNIDDDDPPEVVREKLTSSTGQTDDLSGLQEVPIFEVILGVENEGADLPEGEAFQRRLYEIALEAQRTLSASGPNVSVIDDIHWMDHATVDLLIHLFEAVRDTPTCFLCAVRPDTASPGWRIIEHARREFADHYTEVKLDPLAIEDSQALIMGLLGELPSELARHILEKAEGNPFFIEEVVRSLIDSQAIVTDSGHWRVAADAPSVSIPGSLRTLLTARIDRLDEGARQVLQLAAVIGKRFSASLLAKIVGDGQHESALATLARLDLIRQVVDVTELEYDFRHGLIHEAAYKSILMKRRKELHKRIGEMLETNDFERDSALLGFHFFEARDYPRAQTYYAGAGDAATRLYANAEAAEHYEKAIEAARKSAAPSQVLTSLFLRCASVQTLAGNYEAALATYKEMRTLAEKESNHAMLLAALVAEGTIRSTPTPVYDASLAEQLSNQALDLAGLLGDREAEAKILWNLMLLSSFGDDPGQVVEYGARALRITRELGLKEQVAFTLNDLNRAYRAVGDLAEARSVLNESRAMWREADNLPMLTDNLGSSSYLYFMMGDLDSALAFGEEGYQISLKTENLWGQAFNRSGMAYAQFERGVIQDALDGMAESVQVAEQFMMALGQTGVRADLAWMLATMGQIEQGLALAEKAISTLLESQLPPVIHAWTWAAVARVKLIANDLLGVEAALARIPSGIGSETPGTHAPIYAALARGDLLLAGGDAATALVENDAIEVKVRNWHADGDLTEILWQKARILNSIGKPDRAIIVLGDAQNLLERQSARRMLLNILTEKSRIERKLGNRVEADNLYEQTNRILESISDNIRDDATRDSFLQLFPR